MAQPQGRAAGYRAPLLGMERCSLLRRLSAKSARLRLETASSTYSSRDNHGAPAGWTDGLPKAAYDYLWREHRIIPQQSNFRLNASFRTFVQNFHEQVLPLGTEYISAWNALCRGSDCITGVGRDVFVAGEDVVFL